MQNFSWSLFKKQRRLYSLFYWPKVCSYVLSQSPLFWDLLALKGMVALKKVNRIRVWLARKKVRMAVKLETDETCHMGLLGAFNMKLWISNIFQSQSQYSLNLFIWLRNPLFMGSCGVHSEHWSELKAGRFSGHILVKILSMLHYCGSLTSRHWILSVFPTQQSFCEPRQWFRPKPEGLNQLLE